MKISLEWLNDYVDVKEFLKKPEELAKALTAAGLEVEGFTDRAKPYANVVLGQVAKLDKHPNADKLTLCQVDVGDGKLRQIVCGAKNHKQGDKVVVALPGAVLPGDFAIKLSKIRDVESQGMLCSEVELGLAKESPGIMILSADAKLGMGFAEYYGLSDVVFEVNVTPNRADCLSHVGLAREISCLLDRPLKMPETKIKKAAGAIKKSLDVQLKAPELCPRYTGRGVMGVKVGPSPRWLTARLEAVGVNPINNIVDIGNFVMMELGQPLHMFDLDNLAGKKLTIENSKREKFTSFDGTTYELTGEELTIRDGEKAVVIAGVIGSANSGVTDKTANLFIESAHFNQTVIRRTSRRFGVDTDSSYRFSRGTDPEGVLTALNRAAALIQELAGGTPTEDHYDLYPKPIKRESVKVRRRILEERLGYKIEMNDFANWMKRLHCKVAVKGEDATVEVPSFRWDLEIEMDLVEEYGRLNGYDKVPETFPPLLTAPTHNALSFDNENRLANELAGQGYQEAVHYAFLNNTWQSALFDRQKFKTLGLEVGGDVVPVMNPLSEETGVMRQSLLPGLLANLLHNFNRGNLFGRVFEIGTVFGKGAAAESAGGAYREYQRVALSAWGQPSTLWEKTERLPVYDLKAAIEATLKSLQATGFQWRPVDATLVPAFIHPGQVAVLFYQGKNVGFVGALHPALRDEHKLRVPVAVAEFDLDLIMAGQPRTPKYKPISKFPAVERDIALLIPNDLIAQDIIKEIEKAGGEALQSVHIFDVYRGQGTPEGFASIAFRMVFQDLTGTMADDKITALVGGITSALEKKYQIKTR
jgi:phenylalanyl-tRNA synthetase beta chain